MAIRFFVSVNVIWHEESIRKQREAVQEQVKSGCNESNVSLIYSVPVMGCMLQSESFTKSERDGGTVVMAGYIDSDTFLRQ